jgi:hypothetical protein
MSAEAGNNVKDIVKRNMSVTVVIDEQGQVRTTAAPGMNMIEVLCMLQVAHESLHTKAVEKSKVVIPPAGSPFSVVRNEG